MITSNRPAVPYHFSERGVVLSADGSRAVIADAYNADFGVPECGAIQVFTRSGNAYSVPNSGFFVYPDNCIALKHYGYTIAMSANGEYVAASTQNDGGKVYLTRIVGTTVTAIQTLLGSAGCEEVEGMSFTFDGGLLAVGHPTCGSSGEGSVWLYTRVNGNSFSHSNTVTVVQGAASGTQFGYRVALTRDGSMLLVGAPGYSVPNASDVGAVFVFRWSTGADAFEQVRTVVRDTPVAGDKLGSAVAVSGDGTTAALGSLTEEKVLILTL